MSKRIIKIHKGEFYPVKWETEPNLLEDENFYRGVVSIDPTFNLSIAWTPVMPKVIGSWSKSEKFMPYCVDEDSQVMFDLDKDGYVVFMPIECLLDESLIIYPDYITKILDLNGNEVELEVENG